MTILFHHFSNEKLKVTVCSNQRVSVCVLENEVFVSLVMSCSLLMHINLKSPQLEIYSHLSWWNAWTVAASYVRSQMECLYCRDSVARTLSVGAFHKKRLRGTLFCALTRCLCDFSWISMGFWPGWSFSASHCHSASSTGSTQLWRWQRYGRPATRPAWSSMDITDHSVVCLFVITTISYTERQNFIIIFL